MFETQKILIVSAHPDDEVLGCGGSLAKWSKNGHEVHVLIMAEGTTSRDKERDRTAHHNELLFLAKSAKKAGEILGVRSVELLDFPDNRMDSMDLLDVIKVIEEFIDKMKPQLVVTHHGGDLNNDHQIVHQAVITSCRPQLDNPVKQLLFFEVPSSTEWQVSSTKNAFCPNWFEDISETLGFKLKALEEYKSEIHKWPHPRSLQAVEHLARWRGASVSCEAAEAFMLARIIK